MLSSVEYFLNDNYDFIPGLGIVGSNEMWSIRLFYLGEISEIKNVLLDSSSLTTNAFLQIICKKCIPHQVDFFNITKNSPVAMLPVMDAFLKIGDPCLQHVFGNDSDSQKYSHYQQWDLVSEWKNLTGQPFVFALWLFDTSRNNSTNQAIQLLQNAREQGSKNAEEIAREWAPKLKLTMEQTLQYITEIVHYDLGREEMKGLLLFGEELVKIGLLDESKFLPKKAKIDSLLASL